MDVLLSGLMSDEIGLSVEMWPGGSVLCRDELLHSRQTSENFFRKAHEAGDDIQTSPPASCINVPTLICSEPELYGLSVTEA